MRIEGDDRDKIESGMSEEGNGSVESGQYFEDERRLPSRQRDLNFTQEKFVQVSK